MPADPYNQREDERAREDDDYARALSEAELERAIEQSDPVAVARARRHLRDIAAITRRERGPQ